MCEGRLSFHQIFYNHADFARGHRNDRTRTDILQFSEIAFLKACNEVRLVVYLVFCVAILKVVVG